jgi:hypothetical protein
VKDEAIIVRVEEGLDDAGFANSSGAKYSYKVSLFNGAVHFTDGLLVGLAI